MIDAFAQCRMHRAFRPTMEAGIYPYYRTARERPGAVEVILDGETLIMAGSNDYLALASDPRLREAACRATTRFGTSTTGSRLTTGSLCLHEELEEALAAFLGCEAAMVTSAGYLACLALGAIATRSTTVFADELIHASLIDGVALGRARLSRFRHNDMAHLERLLEAANPSHAGLILTEGMFSTTGDVCDLAGIAKLAEHHGVRVVLDGAHDVGLLGPKGGGAADYHGLHDSVDLHLVTFSKCFASIGGAVAGPEEIILYLRHQARSMLFTAALSPGCTAAALAALDVIVAEPERRRLALDGATRLSAELTRLGLTHGLSPTPIVRVPVDDELLACRMWTELLAEGVLATVMIPPGVPEGGAFIRLSVTAAHTEEHLDRIAAACENAGRRLGLLS